MSNKAYLSLGSNIGERFKYLKKAISLLNAHPKISISKISSIYETDPVGFEEQNCFLNIVVEINTSLTAMELLNYCLQVEKDLGRIRNVRWGPRTIDIDVLLYNEEIYESNQLTIPHPRMHEREFVLIPLTEINPTIIIPKVERNVVDALKKISNQKGVRLWKQLNGEDVFELLEN